MRGTDQVVVAFFGDGTTDIGAFHETLNLADQIDPTCQYLNVNAHLVHCSDSAFGIGELRPTKLGTCLGPAREPDERPVVRVHYVGSDGGATVVELLPEADRNAVSMRVDNDASSISRGPCRPSTGLNVPAGRVGRRESGPQRASAEA